MVMTTTLGDYEQNLPTQSDYLNEVWREVRERTGENWQVVERKFISKRFLRKPKTTIRYELLVEVGGCLPFQVITCARNYDAVLAYLLGLLSGLSHAKSQ